jgi:urea-proton symporter
MGLLALMLLQVGASLQYVYLAMGVLIGSAVIPISLAIVWKRTNKVAATAGALAGLVWGVTIGMLRHMLSMAHYQYQPLVRICHS